MLYNKEPLVLIVHQQQTVAQAIIDRLKQERLHNTSFVLSAVQALKYAQNKMPDLILIDEKCIELKNAAAGENSIIKLIKALPEGEQSMLLVLLADSNIQIVNQSYTAGADGFELANLPKQLLAKKLRYYLRNKRKLESYHRLENIVDEFGVLAGIGYWQYQPRRNQFYVSATVAHLYRASRRNFRTFDEFINLHDSNCKQKLKDTISAVIKDGKERSLNLEINIADKIFNLQCLIKADEFLLDTDLIITGHVVDVSNQNSAQAAILMVDKQTGLPSEQSLRQHLSQVIQHNSTSGNFISVLAINIDGFNRINSIFGFATGDALLVNIAKRINSFATAANEKHSLFKLAGDEFVLVMDAMANPDGTTKFVRDLQGVLCNPFSVDTLSVNITASIGIAVYPLDSRHLDELLTCATTALKHAKRQGRNNYQYFVESLNRESYRLMGLESDLRQALNSNELELYYQPKINLQTKQVAGCEALLRWNHASLGTVSPVEFISLAEDIGIMNQLGAWVLDQACAQAKIWLEKGYKYTVAVNVSSTQLQEPRLFLQTFKNILDKHELPAKYIELELTESVFLDAAHSHLEFFELLQQLGVKIAIDDFGTGFSSMSYLMTLNADTLKIDRSFIMGVEDSFQQSQVVQSIIDLAKKINMQVVAEGVSSKSEEEFLLQTTCDYAQGFFYAKAMPGADFEHWAEGYKQ